MFAASNGLDPTAFPSLLQMENDLVALTGGLLDAPDGFAGSVTSGGTESILLAVLAARQGSPATADPSMVIPTSAHAAFHKAAEFLGVRARARRRRPRHAARRPRRHGRGHRRHDGARRRLRPVVRPRRRRPGARDRGRWRPSAASAATSTRASAAGCCRTSTTRRPGPSPSRASRASASTCTSTRTPPRASRCCCTAPRRCAAGTSSRPRTGRATRCSTARCSRPARAGRSPPRGPSPGGSASTATPPSPGRRARRRSRSRPRRTASRASARSPRPTPPSSPSWPTSRATCSPIADEMLERGWFVQPQMSFRAVPPTLHLTLSAATAPSVPELVVALRESVEAARAAGPVARGPRARRAAGVDRPRHPRRRRVRRAARGRRARGQRRHPRPAPPDGCRSTPCSTPVPRRCARRCCSVCSTACRDRPAPERRHPPGARDARPALALAPARAAVLAGAGPHRSRKDPDGTPRHPTPPCRTASDAASRRCSSETIGDNLDAHRGPRARPRGARRRARPGAGWTYAELGAEVDALARGLVGGRHRQGRPGRHLGAELRRVGARRSTRRRRSARSWSTSTRPTAPTSSPTCSTSPASGCWSPRRRSRRRDYAAMVDEVRAECPGARAGRVPRHRRRGTTLLARADEVSRRARWPSGRPTCDPTTRSTSSTPRAPPASPRAPRCPPQHPQQRLLRRRAAAATPRRTGSASRCPSTTASAW